MPADANEGRTLEDMNLKGGTADNPSFADSLFGGDSSFRKKLFAHGMLFRMQASGDYIQNTLAAPVWSSEQNYTGQRQFGGYSLNPVFTADLRQLGLKKTQLDINGELQQASWGPAQPTAWTVSNLYIYHEFGMDRSELKFGYLTTDFQFIGLQVGGQVASGAQGVYAVLPYEVGLAHSPLPAPAITFKFKIDKGVYVKGAVQRAAQPGSTESALGRDGFGLRFWPKGDERVLIGELGLKRKAADGVMQQWIRGGYITNNTKYTSLKTGEKKSGNYCAYLLADRELWQPDGAHPGRGIYAGASAMVVPADLDTYRLYYEGRMYYSAPFRSRPDDFVSLVASYTAHSQDKIHQLIKEGKSYWRASDSLTGSYTMHMRKGVYMGLGLSYVNGPAVTPKVASALTFTAQTSVFF